MIYSIAPTRLLDIFHGFQRDTLLRLSAHNDSIKTILCCCFDVGRLISATLRFLQLDVCINKQRDDIITLFVYTISVMSFTVQAI